MTTEDKDARIATLEAQLAEKDAENERLRKALEFYADEDRWHDFESDQMSAAFDRNFGTEFSADMGALSRRALEGGE